MPNRKALDIFFVLFSIFEVTPSKQREEESCKPSIMSPMPCGEIKMSGLGGYAH